MNNLMKILIAYDGSAGADFAIEDLERAGLPAEAEALVVSVKELWLPTPPMSGYEIVEGAILPEGSTAVQLAPEVKEFHTPAEGLAMKAKVVVQELFPAWAVTHKSVVGSPATEILTLADQWGADLVVVGSHGHTALGRFFFGSVSQKIVTEARCTVRVSRCDIEGGYDQERILIGFDGSLGAEAAVEEVVHRKFPAETEARLIMVCDPLKPSLAGYLLPKVVECVEESNRQERDWAKTTVRQQADRLDKAGLLASYAVKEGDPRRILVGEAEDWGATTIFVGARGLTKFDRFLLGSVSAAVTARAHCSVEVVRPRVLV